MKKNKRTLSLLVGLLSVFGLAGCTNDVTALDESLVTFTGAGGEQITIKTDDIYNGVLESQDSIKSLYDALIEVAIRIKMSGEEFTQLMASINKTAASLVEGYKEDAKKKASENNTRYEEEWDRILESNGVETEKELLDKVTYRLMQEEHREKFFSTQRLSDLLMEADTGYVDQMIPYHVRHILVKTNGSNRNFVGDTIGKDEAEKLASVIRQLAYGRNSFGEIARENSEDNAGDSSSASKYGDLGIMSKTTGFVNEFKLGVYANDLFYNKDRVDANSKDVIGISDDKFDAYKDIVGLETIGQIPYGTVQQLLDVSDVTRNDDGGVVNDGDSRYYPRNVIFNRFFNRHNISVITPNDVAAPTIDSSGKVTNEDMIGTENPAYISEWVGSGDGWIDLEMPDGTTVKALSDGKGNPILVARAGTDGYQGIHFIVVDRNPMDRDADTTDPLSANIKDYYTTLIPGDAGFPQTSDGKDKRTFVTSLVLDRTEQQGRADDIKNAIKTFDPSIDYRMYEELFSDLQLEFSDPRIKEKVESYIDKTRQSNEWNAEKVFSDAWNEYILMLQRQEDLRNQEGRLLSMQCALGFNDNNTQDAFTKPGGACYYVKK